MKTHELFTDADLARLEKKWKTARITAAALALLGLAICAGLCRGVTIHNAWERECTVTLVSTLTGWIALYLWLFPVQETRRILAHARMLRDSPRERIIGSIAVTGERLRLRGSIALRLVRSEGAPGRKLRVVEERADVLSEAHGLAAVYVANGYVAAWEETP